MEFDVAARILRDSGKAPSQEPFPLDDSSWMEDDSTKQPLELLVPGDLRLEVVYLERHIPEVLVWIRTNPSSRDLRLAIREEVATD